VRTEAILVVDDEPPMRKYLSANLRARGYDVTTAEDGTEALQFLAERSFDLLILDIMMPGPDGLALVQAVRGNSGVPVLMLSARGREADKVQALDLGADDYLTKPFGVNELLARIRVALRHAATPNAGSDPVIRVGDIEVDLEHRRVTSAGHEMHLTPTEWDLMKLFVTSPDKVLTDRAILQAVWGSAYRSQAHSLHVYVARLRKKLEATGASRRHLLTEPGVGYRFTSEGIEVSR
jgi:two-component system, OmpR family, KDP operon response regulator KdpE